MIKYFNDLDRPNNTLLHLSRSDSPVYNIHYKCLVPDDFFKKYYKAFEYAKDVDLLIRFLNFNDVQLRMKSGKLYEPLKDTDDGGYYLGEYFGELKQIKAYLCGINSVYYRTQDEIEYMEKCYYSKLPPNNEIITNVRDLSEYFLFYANALKYLLRVCSEYKREYDHKLDVLFDTYNALNPKICYGEEVTVTGKKPNDPWVKIFQENLKPRWTHVPITMKNEWYITPYGDLYNGGGKYNLYEAEDEFLSFLDNYDSQFDYKLITKLEDSEFYKRYMFTKKSDYTFGIDYYRMYRVGPSYPQTILTPFTWIFNEDSFEPIETIDYSYEFPSDRVYNRQFFRAVLGARSTETDFKQFILDICQYTDNPKEELEHVLQWAKTRQDKAVRVAGMHKIETVLPKTITTSRFLEIKNLKEYLERGWDIYYIPPILIDKENNTLINKDYNLSLIEERYIEKYLETYEQERQEQHGRIYVKR